MKTLNLKQMEVIEGGSSCSEEQKYVMLGSAVALTILGGPIGAWIGVGLLYSCAI